MNLQDKINWFKLNGWLSTHEVEPSTVDVTSFNTNGYIADKMVVGSGYHLACWTAASSNNQYEGRGDTEHEAIENLYDHMKELLWERIRTVEEFLPVTSDFS